MKNHPLFSLKLFAAFFFCFLALHTQAQQKQDVIYLNNGSILRGEILQQNQDSIVKIEIAGGSVFAVPVADIKEIVSEKRPALPARDSGFYNCTEISNLWGQSIFSQTTTGIGFETVNGIYLNKYLQTGLGAGIYYMEDNFLNLYGNGKFTFLPGKTTPYIYADAGLNFLLMQENDKQFYKTKPGLMIASGLGLQFHPQNGNIAFIISAGYKVNKYKVIFDDGNPSFSYIDAYTLNRLAIKLGFIF